MTEPIARGKISVDDVNRAARESAQAFFLASNEHYEKQVAAVVARVTENTDCARLIMLSGPSSSGKTTTSHKLRHGLLDRGVHAITISMDDFFRGRNEAPLLPAGTRDYESLGALDAPLLTQCLTQLTLEGRARLPVVDFRAGKRAPEPREVSLALGDVAIVEGLHALDPVVTQGVPASHTLKLYVSVSSDFVEGAKPPEGGARTPVLTAREVRLVRRMVRDFRYRSSSPDNTLSMWPAVCRGEDLYVRPFKRNADMVINSVLACEPCLFRGQALPLLETVAAASPHYAAARHLLEALGRFAPMDSSLMPPECVLREFLGGSPYFGKNAK